MQGIGLIGNLTKPPTVTALTGNRHVSRFTVAIDDGYRDAAGEWHKRPPIFVAVECWNDATTSASWDKGAKVVVVGHWRAEEYEKDGERKRAQFFAADAAALVPRNRAETTRAATGTPALGLDPDDPYAIAQ